jgi:hypothetical protein
MNSISTSSRSLNDSSQLAYSLRVQRSNFPQCTFPSYPILPRVTVSGPVVARVLRLPERHPSNESSPQPTLLHPNPPKTHPHNNNRCDKITILAKIVPSPPPIISCIAFLAQKAKPTRSGTPGSGAPKSRLLPIHTSYLLSIGNLFRTAPGSSSDSHSLSTKPSEYENAESSYPCSNLSLLHQTGLCKADDSYSERKNEQNFTDETSSACATLKQICRTISSAGRRKGR